MLQCTSPGVFADEDGRSLAELDHTVDAAGDTWRTLVDTATHATFVSYEPVNAGARAGRTG
jgi:hypothetical protein